ncbi:MAG: diguanylate cyclase [Acidobacteriota bacterium]|nr:diguanylate cyclase [Acidobacteriota bacterium]
MDSDFKHGCVFVLCHDDESGERLGRWIAEVGERPMLFGGDEKYRLDNADGAAVDLVVSDLDTDDPSARALLDRLVAGQILDGVPQLHLFRDPAMREAFAARQSWIATTALPSPPDADEFRARVRLAAEMGRLRRELRRVNICDPVTNLLNRRHLVRRLEEEFARARRYRSPLSLVFFDIDHLKRINDTWGQTTGDAVIELVSDLLRSKVRKGDVLGRIGEESFAVVLPNNRYRGAAIFASNIRTELSHQLPPFASADERILVSAGVSSFPDNNSISTADDLIRATEDALRAAKERGGNRVYIDEEVLEGEKRLILVADSDNRLLELAEDLLTVDDYRIDRADSAAMTLEKLRFRRPDLLVLDLHMTDANHGVSLIERIHKLFPKDRFPIVGLSNSSETDPVQVTRLGVDRFITKPFSLTLLRSVVRELLDTYTPAEV